MREKLGDILMVQVSEELELLMRASNKTANQVLKILVDNAFDSVKRSIDSIFDKDFCQYHGPMSGKPKIIPVSNRANDIGIVAYDNLDENSKKVLKSGIKEMMKIQEEVQKELDEESWKKTEEENLQGGIEG